jgi:bifunctional DNA-binding transcriptional regulator/antitoxin component of YhaV-PrlF toxin-antitoxin module
MIANMISKMLSRGRVTIPIDLRRKYGMTPGARLIVREVGDQIVVMTMEQQVRSMRGVLPGDAGMRALREDRSEEREL